MKSKKTAPKKTKKVVAEKLQSNKVEETKKTTPKKSVSVDTTIAKATNSKTITSKAPNLATKLGLFDNCVKKNGRVFLKPPREFADFPDLLALQKKGYDEFINKYLNKLFDNINPVRDIAGEKMYVAISDIKVSEPIDDVKTCKKKELTY